MAKFPRTEARQELGFTPATGVRADIDVRTGTGAVGAAIANLGATVIDLGEKWDLVAAKSQLSKSTIDASDRISKYFLELDGNDDPATYRANFDKLTKDLDALAPRNTKALRVYSENIAKQKIQLASQTRQAGKDKLKANAQEVDFLLLQKAKASGDANDFLKYNISVIGNLDLGDVYTATEAERLLDNARSERELIQKRAEIANDEALEVRQEADRDELGKALFAGSIDYTMIDNSSLEEKEQEQWRVRMNAEVARKAAGTVIVTDEQVRADLRTAALNIMRGADTKQRVFAAINEARFGEEPTIDDSAYRELTALAETKLEKAQGDFLTEAHRDGQEQLVDLTSETQLALIVAGRMTQLQAERHKVQLWWADRYDNEMEQWVQDNPDKNKREGYQQSQMVLAAYINTPFEEIKALRENVLAGNKKPATKTLIEGEIFPTPRKTPLIEGELDIEDAKARAVSAKDKRIVRMQGPGGLQSSVGVGAVGAMLDRGLKFPPGSNIRVKRNTSDTNVSFEGLTIEHGKRIISFDGGKTWQLLP